MTISPLLTRDFGLLTTGHFLQALGYASFMLFPLYLDALGASRAGIGLVMATGSLAGLLARPLVGWAIDTHGRKPAIVAGTILVALGMITVGFITELGPAAYLSRILFGLGVGGLFTGYVTLVSDVVPAGRRTEGIALFGVSGLLPLLVNPLSPQLGFQGPELRWFIPTVALAVLASLGPLSGVAEPPREHELQPRTWAMLRRTLIARSLWPVWLATVVFAGLVSVFAAFISVAAGKRGMPDPTLVWLTYPLAAATVRLVGARVPDRVGPHNMVAPAFAFYVVAFVVAAGATTSTTFLVAGALAGLGHGYAFPVLTAQVVARVPSSMRGSGLAVFTALWGLSEIVLTPAFGAFADAFGDSAMFGLGGASSVLWLLAWAWLEHRHGAG